MAITQVIHLTQNQRLPYPIMDAVQNDTGRSVKMIIDDETLSSGNTGALYFKRSDNSYYNVSATLATGDNSFTADLTQALTQPGVTECQLHVTASSKVVSTYTFLVRVQPAVNGVPSEEQLGYTVEDIIEASEAAVEAAAQFVIDTALDPESENAVENRIATDAIANITADSENLVNLTVFEAGHITGSGTDDTLAGCFRSTYMPVTPGVPIRLDPNGKFITVVEYDINKAFIALNGYYSAKNTTFLLSGATRYIRFVVRSNPINESDTVDIVYNCCAKVLFYPHKDSIALSDTSQNLIGLTRFEPGHIGGTYGADDDQAGCFRSAYVPVVPGDNLRLDPNSRYLTVVEYNKNGGFIKLNGYYGSNNTTITLSGDTHFIRFVIRSNPINTSDTVSIVNSCCVKRLNYWNSYNTAFPDASVDLISIAQFVPGHLTGSDGSEDVLLGCFRSTFMPVEPYDILAINPNGRYLTVVEYDIKGGFVKLNGYYGSNKTTLTLSSTTRYIRFVIRSNPINESDTVSIVNTCTVKRSQFPRYNNRGMQMFANIGVIGDSVSVGWARNSSNNPSRRNLGISWPQQMARRLGCTAYNLGASGVDPIEWFQSSFEYAQYCYQQYLTTPECELYIIGLGLNGGSMGSVSDINETNYNLNGTTFYGQYARIIQMINDQHPNSKVICLTEPSTKATSYDQAIRDICALSFINAELLDLDNDYYYLFNNSIVMAESQGDNLHYTPYGYSLIAEAMMVALNDYIAKNPTHFKYVGVS